MKDQKFINEINVLLVRALEALRLRDFDNQRKSLEKMYSLYKQLSLKSKEHFKESIYFVHRDLGQLYAISNQYDKGL